MVKKDSNRAATQLVQAIGISAMTDTNHIEVLRNIVDRGFLHSSDFEALREIITALSARASAGEGGDAAIAQAFREVECGNSEAAIYRQRVMKRADELTAAPQPAQAGASGGMTFAFMAEVCDAAVQAMQANGLIKRTIRLQEVRDQLRQLAAAPQPQEVQRPSADWYRRKIMQGDGVEAMAGPLPPFHVCSNPSARHRHGADPMGHCPDCVAQGLGNWSCTPESPTPPAHGDGEGDTRVAFERWVAKRWGCSTERWADSGEYKYDNTRHWWQCWQEALTARPTPEAQLPLGIYWNKNAYNFYSAQTRKGMGIAFHNEWVARRMEFPQSADAALALSAQGEGNNG